MAPGTYTSTNKKAIKQHDQGKKNFEFKKDKEAEKFFLKAIELDPTFVEPHMALGYLYADHKQINKAIEHFKIATEVNPKFFPTNFYDLGGLYLTQGKYTEGRKAYEAFLGFERINPNLKEKADKFLANAKFGEEAMKNPMPIKPMNVGPGVNTANDEYFPSVTIDNSKFYFTRKFNEKNCADEMGQEDFYVSSRSKTFWDMATPLNINTPCNEGAISIAPPGNFLFFVSCADPAEQYQMGNLNGFGSCDIFYSEYVNGKLTKPFNVGGPINTSQWETQPSFSSDGKTLYFIRGVSRGYERTGDIYYSEIGPDGKFGTPIKLGPNVNTDGDEEGVFIHPDNMTLYFASNGRTGMGGKDIYMSKRLPNGDWGPAVNMGYPINSFEDDFSLVADPSGKLAYFTSGREGGYGGLDIYQFDLPQNLRPEPITYAKGIVYDSITRKGLDAEFELIDLETQKQVVKSYSSKDGNFLITLVANHDYLLNVSKKGYLFYSENFSLKSETVADYNNPYTLKVPLQPIDTGYVIELKNVFFDIDKFDLKPESKAELNKLAEFLKKNPNIKGELGGHTDNTGDKKKNQLLSQNRAKSVLDYLVTAGIDKTRLSFKGYGDTKPKFPNDTPEHKAANRRTEFKVFKK